MMTKRQSNQTQNQTHTRHQTCPTCGVYAEFTFLGEQRWPPRVVEKLGVDPVMHLWTCGNCQTTISEPAQDTD